MFFTCKNSLLDLTELKASEHKDFPRSRHLSFHWFSLLISDNFHFNGHQEMGTVCLVTLEKYDKASLKVFIRVASKYRFKELICF